jgi:hypothetical protein
VRGPAAAAGAGRPAGTPPARAASPGSAAVAEPSRSEPLAAGRPAAAGAPAASPGAGPVAASPRPARRLDFVAPGGTRIVWVLDPEFSLAGARHPTDA